VAENPAVTVDRLTKAYGPHLAVDGLSFTVECGEVFGLLGPNGAGKTSTVETLEGYRKADGGSVAVLGLDPIRDHRRLTPRIGVMLQEGGLYPGIRPMEALRLFSAYYAEHEDPDTLLDLVGLRPAAGTLVRRLSGGQKQRLSLALALVGKPEIVFLDEPTAGMDPHARLTTWEVVTGLKERGATVILTTHAMDEAERLCDRVAIIDGGHLVALGTPGDLTRSAGGGETLFTAAPGLDIAGLAAALLLAPAAVVESKPGEYVVHAAPSPELVAALTAWLRDHGVALGDLRAGRRSLEEVFLQVTSEPSTAGGEEEEAGAPSGRRARRRAGRAGGGARSGRAAGRARS
jgi:ABC-2 type transport system ATP-binding protein